MTKPWIMIDSPGDSEADFTSFSREVLLFLISASTYTPCRFAEAKKTGIDRKPDNRSVGRKSLPSWLLF
jgi:hypothetical protein